MSAPQLLGSTAHVMGVSLRGRRAMHAIALCTATPCSGCASTVCNMLDWESQLAMESMLPAAHCTVFLRCEYSMLPMCVAGCPALCGPRP